MPDQNKPDPIFLQRCRMDARWASSTIDLLRRSLDLVVQQVDIPDNKDRTMETFRRGTTMEQARAMVDQLKADEEWTKRTAP